MGTSEELLHDVMLAADKVRNSYSYGHDVVVLWVAPIAFSSIGLPFSFVLLYHF